MGKLSVAPPTSGESVRRFLLPVLMLFLAAPLSAPALAQAAPALVAERPEAPAAPAAAATDKPAYMTEDQPLQLRDYEEPTAARAQEPWWQQLFGFLFKLAMVLGLIYLSLMAVRKFQSGQISLPTAKGRNMVVLESTQLNAQQAIHLVSLAGERLLVVGAGPQGLTTLSEITEPSAIAPFLSAQRGNASAFNQVFDLETVVQEANSTLFDETLREVKDSRRPDTEWPRT